MFGRAGGADVRSHSPPQLRLPMMRCIEQRRRAVGVVGAVAVGAECPVFDQPRALRGVAVEQVGETTSEGPLLRVRATGTGHRHRAGGQHIEHGPREPRQTPRVALGIRVEAGVAERAGHEPTGEQELDVRADAVAAARRVGAQAVAQAHHRRIADADRRHRHDIGRERVGGCGRKHVGEGIEQGAEFVGVVEREHLVVNATGAVRCDWSRVDFQCGSLAVG
ncbi:unannotated protein [freshwater metagenome]|uniref:Unannotated protein n=1 Tax=freshwater metagenome TaxID=449393 RepID=A0A6J7JW43_9ZZZZ